MPRFDPFKPVDCSCGAPMGRNGDSSAQWDGKSRLYACSGGGEDGYDRGGAYWGHSDIYAVWTRGGAFCCYIDGVSSPEAAIKKLKRLHAKACTDTAEEDPEVNAEARADGEAWLAAETAEERARLIAPWGEENEDFNIGRGMD